MDGRLMYLRHLFAYEEAARRIPPDGVVLDVGCGEGYGTDHLAHSAQLAVGIDVDAAALANARLRYARPACQYVRYCGVDVPFLERTVDLAVAFQVIEHVHDDRQFVAEAVRVLQPGGCFLATTPNRLLRLEAGQRPWNRHHVREYAPNELRARLAPYFAKVEILGVAGDAETQAHELARLAWIRRSVARDRLGLGRVLPERLRHGVLKCLRGVPARRSAPGVAEWTTDRYALTADADESLDLFAICTR